MEVIVDYLQLQKVLDFGQDPELLEQVIQQTGIQKNDGEVYTLEETRLIAEHLVRALPGQDQEQRQNRRAEAERRIDDFFSGGGRSETGDTNRKCGSGQETADVEHPQVHKDETHLEYGDQSKIESRPNEDSIKDLIEPLMETSHYGDSESAGKEKPEEQNADDFPIPSSDDMPMTPRSPRSKDVRQPETKYESYEGIEKKWQEEQQKKGYGSLRRISKPPKILVIGPRGAGKTCYLMALTQRLQMGPSRNSGRPVYTVYSALEDVWQGPTQIAWVDGKGGLRSNEYREYQQGKLSGTVVPKVFKTTLYSQKHYEKKTTDRIGPTITDAQGENHRSLLFFCDNDNAPFQFRKEAIQAAHLFVVLPAYAVLPKSTVEAVENSGELPAYAEPSKEEPCRNRMLREMRERLDNQEADPVSSLREWATTYSQVITQSLQEKHRSLKSLSYIIPHGFELLEEFSKYDGAKVVTKWMELQQQPGVGITERWSLAAKASDWMKQQVNAAPNGLGALLQIFNVFCDDANIRYWLIDSYEQKKEDFDEKESIVQDRQPVNVEYPFLFALAQHGMVYE